MPGKSSHKLESLILLVAVATAGIIQVFHVHCQMHVGSALNAEVDADPGHEHHCRHHHHDDDGEDGDQDDDLHASDALKLFRKGSEDVGPLPPQVLCCLPASDVPHAPQRGGPAGPVRSGAPPPHAPHLRSVILLI